MLFLWEPSRPDVSKLFLKGPDGKYFRLYRLRDKIEIWRYLYDHLNVII